MFVRRRTLSEKTVHSIIQLVADEVGRVITSVWRLSTTGLVTGRHSSPTAHRALLTAYLFLPAAFWFMLSFEARRGGEMADATDLKSVDRKVVWVRLPPSAPIHINNLQRDSGIA